MADHAVHQQLPIMVRKPQVVWPGLAKMGMYQKEIAGDGNCLFASLSDQLYGTPMKHPEIRSSIIGHMRTYRPLFEHYVHKDDVQQRRALRSSTLAARRTPLEDDFEEYLALMSQNGTYGGEPELVAFCQVFDQDVSVHLPTIQNYDRDSILYKNEQRLEEHIPQPLHICYGGDEITRAHYDSARLRDMSQIKEHSLIFSDRRKSLKEPVGGPLSRNLSANLSVRARKHASAELSAEQIQDFLQKGRKDLEGTYEQLKDQTRARSSSVSSSHRSSSSKRSLEEDGDPRTNKRADRRKSIKKRLDSQISTNGTASEMSFQLRVETPSPGTPASTQDTEYSSDAAEQADTNSPDDDYVESNNLDDNNSYSNSDSDASLNRGMKAMRAHVRIRRPGATAVGRASPSIRIDVANSIEPRRLSLRQ